ncbi:MAG: hypothetical protein CSA58_03605 [Micrococcales bacterium]|nr:MAG: hypothetical protein CSA58_03605 [Micrococcales bacterium]
MTQQPAEHSQQILHEPEGRSTAAWTAMGICMAACAAGCVGLVLGQRWLFLLGIAGFIAGGIVGRVMTQMGYGVGGANNRGADR